MPTEPTHSLPNKQVPGKGMQPSNNPVDRLTQSASLGDDEERHDQENWAGVDNIEGGGEFPDADTPPDYDAGAPGPDLVGHREHNQGQFNDAQPAAGAMPEGGQRGDAPDE